MAPITNLPQLNQLMNSTMIYAVIVGLVAVLIALAVANMFPWEGGNDKSYIKRRIAFIVIGIVAILGFWLCLRLATSNVFSLILVYILLPVAF